MKIIYSTIIAMSMLLGGAQAVLAEEAIMVIRFNKDVVEYERPLKRVVEAVKAKKSSAFFDVISIVPQDMSKRNNKRVRQHSTFLTKKVIENIKYSGIEDANIRVTYQDSKIVDNGEVHIFVR